VIPLDLHPDWLALGLAVGAWVLRRLLSGESTIRRPDEPGLDFWPATPPEPAAIPASSDFDSNARNTHENGTFR